MTGEKRLTRTSGKTEDKNPQQPRSAAVNVLSGKMLYRRRVLNTQETHGYESQVSPCGKRSSELEEGTARTPVPVGAETKETDVYALPRCVREWERGAGERAAAPCGGRQPVGQKVGTCSDQWALTVAACPDENAPQTKLR